VSEDWIAINKAMWDERVPIHVASEFYDIEGFLAGNSTLRQFELDEVGDVAGLKLVHPQCHFGLDTLSWARRGARVTGLDFSAPAIVAAREVAARSRLYRPGGAQLAAGHRALGKDHGAAGGSRRAPLPRGVPSAHARIRFIPS
jgi:hypothetical protein